MKKIVLGVLMAMIVGVFGNALACDCPNKQAKAEPANCEKCDKAANCPCAKAAEAKAAVPAAAPKVFDAPQKEGTAATCPVMGEKITIKKDTLHSEYKGKHVYFCCPSCKEKFDKDPEKFLK